MDQKPSKLHAKFQAGVVVISGLWARQGLLSPMSRKGHRQS
jgi:hypothetical protein